MDTAELEHLLSEPTPDLVSAFRTLQGNILILGVGGKMGPSLARLARRAVSQSGALRRIIGASRFSNAATRRSLEFDGVETVACDLFNPWSVALLPDAANVIYMAGRKFGTSNDQSATWATNAYLPGAVAQRFPKSRIVAFSTGNVYPFAPAPGDGPDENAPTGPVGEYGQAALARERVFEFFSRRNHTPMAILRLNYAIEPRYGVLHDIAAKVYAGDAVDLSMGYANVIWQRDANAIALRALQHCASPPLVMNVTGRPAQSVRELALQFGRRFGRAAVFQGVEGDTALLSDASRCERLLGVPPVGVDAMIDIVADWILAGGQSLNLPTHFDQREGKF